MLISFLLAYAFVMGSQPDTGEPAPLTSSMDRYAAGQCLGSRVGFRNLRLNCVIGADGTLEQCQATTQDPRVLRLSPVFNCIAGTVTVTNADGSPAIDRAVTFGLNRNIWTVTPRNVAPQD